MTDKQKIYIPKATFDDRQKRDLATLLLEAGFSYVHIWSDPGPDGKRRPYIEFGLDSLVEDKP